MAYTTADFLASVRLRGMIPAAASNSLSDQNLLNLATEELHITLLPMMMATREEWYVAKLDQPILASVDHYPIPARASGLVLRDVQLVVGTQISSLPQQDSETISTTATGTPNSYYLEHSSLVLYPSPAATANTLRMRYFQRPSRLALTTSCAQITAIDTVGNTVTVSSIPASWTAGIVIDFVKGTVPYQPAAVDQTVTNIIGSTIYLAALPATLAVGDWVALAEYTPIPQVPFEFQAVLAQMTVVKALEAIGDRDGMQAAQAKMKEMVTNALMLITPRNQGEVKKVTNTVWRNNRRW